MSVDAASAMRSTLPLDNVVWKAIDGPCRDLAERNGRAGRFLRDVAPFAAVADDGDPAAWRDLAGLLGPGHRALLFLPEPRLPDGWVDDHRIPCFQMVAEKVATAPRDGRLVELGPHDVDDMIGLVAATQPGPFAKRTIELGAYFGYRVDGRLVAMAGERCRCPGWSEVSAVCTADDHRGQGLGAALTLAVVSHIRSCGDEAFLHVATENTTAARLYESLGFTTRCQADVVILRPPEDG